MKTLVLRKELLSSLAYGFVYTMDNQLLYRLNEVIHYCDKQIKDKFKNDDGFYYYDFKTIMEFRNWLYNIVGNICSDYSLNKDVIEMIIEDTIKRICDN